MQRCRGQAGPSGAVRGDRPGQGGRAGGRRVGDDQALAATSGGQPRDLALGQRGGGGDGDETGSRWHQGTRSGRPGHWPRRSSTRSPGCSPRRQQRGGAVRVTGADIGEAESLIPLRVQNRQRGLVRIAGRPPGRGPARLKAAGRAGKGRVSITDSMPARGKRPASAVARPRCAALSGLPWH